MEIDEFMATMSFKHDTLIYAQKNWEEIATRLNKILNIEPPLPINDGAAFDFFLAVIFIQSRVPYNIIDIEQGERIWQYLKNTFVVEPEYGDYAIDSLNTYLKIWEKYTEKGLNPYRGIASILLHKMGFKEKSETDILPGTMVMDILMLTTPWWKHFFEKNKLLKSDIPVDSKEFKKYFDQNNK